MVRLRVAAITKPSEVASVLRARGEVELEKALTTRELLTVATVHFSEKYGRRLGELMVRHDSADSEVLSKVFEAFGETASLANEIATSGRCDARLLLRLGRHSFPSVREHAALGLARLELQGCGGACARRQLDENQGDSGVALGMRSMLASHPETPGDVLEELADDEADFIASTAQEELQRRGR